MCDSIKNLELRDNSGSSEWTQCSHNIPQEEKREEASKGTTHNARGWKAGKSKDVCSPLDTPERTQCC